MPITGNSFSALSIMDGNDRRQEWLLSNERKNAHTLINSLAPELLVRILILARNPLAPEQQSYIMLCNPRANPHLKVCRHWRRVILNTPEYWKDIIIQLTWDWQAGPIRHREWQISTESILRSHITPQISLAKNYPIDLNLIYQTPLSHPEKLLDFRAMIVFLKLFGEYLPRLRLNSYIESGPVGIWNIIRSAVGLRFQDLTKLVLHKPTFPGRAPPAFISELPPTVTDETSQVEFPKLRHLELLDWDILLPGTLHRFQAPELRTLRLSIISSTTGLDALSLPGLLEDLQQFPVLDTFKLYAKYLNYRYVRFPECRFPPHRSVRVLSFGLADLSEHPQAPARGFGSLLLSTLMRGFPDLTKLILLDLYFLGDEVIEEEDVVNHNLSIEELHIVSDGELHAEFQQARRIPEMSWFLSSLSAVRFLKLGSEVGRYKSGTAARVPPIDRQGDVQVQPDPDHTFVIDRDVDFVLMFLIKSALHQNRIFLPALELITLPKVTLDETSLRALQDILELRSGSAKKDIRAQPDSIVRRCRVTFRSCRFAAQCEPSKTDPRGFRIAGTDSDSDWKRPTYMVKYFRFPDREELDYRQLRILAAVFQEDLEEMKEMG